MRKSFRLMCIHLLASVEDRPFQWSEISMIQNVFPSSQQNFGGIERCISSAERPFVKFT